MRERVNERKKEWKDRWNDSKSTSSQTGRVKTRLTWQEGIPFSCRLTVMHSSLVRVVIQFPLDSRNLFPTTNIPNCFWEEKMSEMQWKWKGTFVCFQERKVERKLDTNFLSCLRFVRHSFTFMLVFSSTFSRGIASFLSSIKASFRRESGLFIDRIFHSRLCSCFSLFLCALACLCTSMEHKHRGRIQWLRDEGPNREGLWDNNSKEKREF